MDTHVPRRRAHSWKGFAIELVTVTAGVLIALTIDSLVEWNHYRVLVREARETIHREISENEAELQGTMKKATERQQQLDRALTFADDLLRTHKTAVDSLNLGINLAELTSTGFQSAEQTGALSHMAYTEVQRYSKVYGAQELFVTRQRRTLEHLGAATSILGAGRDPQSLSAEDLRAFRTNVLALRAALVIDDQFGEQLLKTYAEVLKR